MNIEELRLEIDDIDNELVKLLVKRAELVEGIGDYKKANNLPVLDSERERMKLNQVVESNEDYHNYLEDIYRVIMDASKKLEH